MFKGMCAVLYFGTMQLQWDSTLSSGSAFWIYCCHGFSQLDKLETLFSECEYHIYTGEHVLHEHEHVKLFIYTQRYDAV